MLRELQIYYQKILHEVRQKTCGDFSNEVIKRRGFISSYVFSKQEFHKFAGKFSIKKLIN